MQHWNFIKSACPDARAERAQRGRGMNYDPSVTYHMQGISGHAMVRADMITVPTKAGRIAVNVTVLRTLLSDKKYFSMIDTGRVGRCTVVRNWTTKRLWNVAAFIHGT